MKKILTIMALALTLQGCIFVAGAAAGAAGIAVVYDHRKIRQVIQDQQTTNSISDQICSDPQLGNDNAHVDVTTFNNVVLLMGQAPTPCLRMRAEQIARNTPNVKRVYNQIALQGPSSSLTRASDSWITTKIKTQLLATAGLRSSSIKVVTENGSVYLMGIVSHEQADTAADIARQVSGVQRVVKVFQYRD